MMSRDRADLEAIRCELLDVWWVFNEAWRELETYTEILESVDGALDQSTHDAAWPLARLISAHPGYGTDYYPEAAGLEGDARIDVAARKLADDNRRSFEQIGFKAAIVLGHSALDALLSDVLGIVAKAFHERLERLVDGQTIPLKDVRLGAASDRLREATSARAQQLQGDALTERIRAIEIACGQLRPTSLYTYDESRLNAASRLRHDVAHGSIREILPEHELDAKLSYLKDTGLFYVERAQTAIQLEKQKVVLVVDADRQVVGAIIATTHPTGSPAPEPEPGQTRPPDPETDPDAP